LRNLPWASIDNDDSFDLDQLTVAEALPDNAVRIRVAVADVEILVKRDTDMDEHTCQNKTSIYTANKPFPMLPERLSTGLNSLNFQEDRPGIVIRCGG
jgi:exoribonuclease R